MAKIVSLQELKNNIDIIKKNKKTIVLVGGCFDILHIGHVKFLEEAKQEADYLMVLLESDKKVKKLKGANRPIFSQKERAQVLSSLKHVDYVVMLPPISTDIGYENIISSIKPDFIAVTESDPILLKKKSQARKVGGKIKIVAYLKTLSSSKLASVYGVD